MTDPVERLRERFDRDSVTSVTNVYRALLAAILGFALWVRMLPADQMQYVQALDPYMIARMAAGMAQNGFLTAVDVLRFYPFTTPTHILNLGNIYIPAYLFEVARLFGINFLEWVKLYPALMGALAVIPVYMLVSHLYDRQAGVISSFFLATSVAIMQRSSAGWFEKEPVANLLMLSSMYLFVTAWARRDWRRGIGSGLFLGVAGFSWGGTKFLYLLYPTTIFALLVVIPLIAIVPTLMAGRRFPALMEYDGLFAAYAPTVLLGTTIPFIMNGTVWTLPNGLFMANMAALVFVGLRYAVDKYDLIEEGRRAYVNPGMFVAGLVALALAPLYSSTLWSYVQSVLIQALQSGGSVIGGTVAENLPAAISDIIGQLGARYAAAVFPGAGMYSEFFGGWTFSLIGMVVVGISVLLMMLRTYADQQEVNLSSLLGGAVAGVSGLSVLTIYAFYTARNAATAQQITLSQFISQNAGAFMPAILITTVIGIVLYLGEYLRSDEFEQWTVIAIMMVLGLMAFAFVLRALVPIGILGIALGAFFVYQPASDRRRSIDMQWQEMIMLVWIASTLYGATQKSRLLFLTATPVAVVGGIAVAHGIRELDASRIWEQIESVDGRMAARMVIAVLLIGIVAINGASVYVTAEGVQYNGRSVGGIGGSPNQYWMDALTTFRNQTEPGTVLLSWWDYGYWFQSIANRPSIADGGNYGFYKDGNDLRKVNYPIADFLTASNASEWREWLDSYGADRIVLDHSMIGKYSAVSQIARGSNSDFHSMQSVSCVTRAGRCITRSYNNQTVVPYRFGQSQILVPVRQSQQGLFFDGTPIMRLGQQNIPVKYLCTDRGLFQTTEAAASSGGLNPALSQSVRQGVPFGGCLAPDPLRGFRQLIVVPPAVRDDTLVELYLMDGAPIPFVEKTFDNGYVKSWRIEGR